MASNRAQNPGTFFPTLIQTGIDLANQTHHDTKEAIMEWDEVFALLTVGATAPYTIELAATWFRKSSWPVFHHHKGAKTQG